RRPAGPAANDNEPAPTTRPVPTDAEDTAPARLPRAETEPDPAALPRSPLIDEDGNVVTRLPHPDEADLAIPARSRLTDDAEAAALLRRDAGDDPDRVVRTYDPDKTPVDGTPAVKQQDLDEMYAEHQKQPPRTLNDHIEDYDRPFGRRIYDTVDLTDRDLTRLGHMPENSRIMATNPRDLEAALHNYHKMRAHDTNREVMLVQDRETGMYMVVQGGPGRVVVPPGPWNVLQHSHPRILLTSTNANDVLVRSIPSGKPGDIHTVMVEVDALVASAPAGTIVSRTSVIDIQVADAAGNVTVYQTRFGVIGEGPTRGIWVEFHNPKNNNAIERHSFSNLAEYEAHVLKTTGVDLTKQGADAVLSVGSARQVRPPVSHGDAIPPQVRADVDFIASRMAMHDDFDQQVRGLREHGDLDPHLGRAATLEDAHARVRAMGLVGEPDSMIRLHNIINDESIPLPVRTMISDITLAATQRQMVETGQLQPGEPLIMLFHGANNARARDMVENGISMARRPGGISDDFGEGLYFTQHLESARVYAKGRGGTSADGNGLVIPYILRGSDLGTVVNVRTGAQHRAAWEAFVSANTRLFAKLNIDPAFLRLPSTMEALLNNRPLPFGSFDAEGRGKVFNAFVESLGSPHNRPDIIFGDLGGPLTSGVQFRGGVTDQAAVRSQRLADILNEQHVRRPAVASVDGDDAGPVMRSLIGPNDGHDSAQKLPANVDAPVATDVGVTPALSAVERLSAHYPAALKAVLDGLPQELRTSVQRDMLRLNMVDQARLINMLMEPDAQVRQRMLFDLSADQLDQQMQAGNVDWDHISGTVRNLIVIEGVIGPSIRSLAEHMAMISDPNYVPPNAPAKFTKAIAESPFLHSLAISHPQILADFETRYFRNNANRSASGDEVETALINTARALANFSTDANIQALGRAILDLHDQRSPAVLSYRDALELAINVARAEIAGGPSIQRGLALPALPKDFTDRVPISNATSKPGMIVDHPVHGRGTIVAVGSDHVDVIFPGLGKNPAPTRLNFAQGEVFPARNPGAATDLPVVPILNPTQRQQGQADIDHIRTQEGFGNYERKAEAGTVSIARAGNFEAVGTNSTMAAKSATLSHNERADLLRMMVAMGLDPHSTTNDPRFVHHAELASLVNLRAAIREAGGTMPTVVDLHVDRATCNSCLKNLSLVAAYLGIEELRVYTRGNMGDGAPLIVRGRR
ncbi:MAG: hypothetical protein RL481_809, partial [Pseudomonadota bacterium]